MTADRLLNQIGLAFCQAAAHPGVDCPKAETLSDFVERCITPRLKDQGSAAILAHSAGSVSILVQDVNPDGKPGASKRVTLTLTVE